MHVGNDMRRTMSWAAWISFWATRFNDLELKLKNNVEEVW